MITQSCSSKRKRNYSKSLDEKAREEKRVKVLKLEKQLVKLCMKQYDIAVGGRHFIPRYPYVLVRVLPKEHKSEGGIWLADTAQNKPVYEGIVIATWRPFNEYRSISETEAKEYGFNVNRAQLSIRHQSDLTPGQRIAFPHYEGIALGEYLDDKYYRLVREKLDHANLPHMGVLGILDYQADEKILAKIRKLTNQVASVTISGAGTSRGA